MHKIQLTDAVVATLFRDIKRLLPQAVTGDIISSELAAVGIVDAADLYNKSITIWHSTMKVDGSVSNVWNITIS